MSKIIILKFGEWLSHFKAVDLPIGDLAKDMISRGDIKAFNKVTTSNQLDSLISDSHVLEISRQAFNYYLVSHLE